MSEPQKTIFLDRDGTLIEEVNFLSSVDDLQLFPFTREALKLLRSSGFRIVVITNQSGIARGIYDEEAMHAIHRQIQIELDGAIDAFYFCPHLPDAGCVCRKPNIGMIENAKRDFAIDMANSWMIGDKSLDIEAGQNAEIKTAMVMTGYGREQCAILMLKPTLIADDLLEAVSRIIEIQQA
ncbi:MAG: D-glycero-alpha-D-manno-heptose-1,7-bisphosphate 7-phosphatase [Pyrinomonadaceae bacterium]